MAVKFFNFGSDETFHFFRWVTEGGHVDPSALVARALAEVEGDPAYEIGMDVSSVAKDKLAAILDDLLEELSPFTQLNVNEIGDVDRSTESLFEPLLELALNRIDLHATAQAMLIRAGKWAPDRDRPEIQ